MYDSLTIGNRWALKRFSHRRRFARALQLLALRPGARVLDFGAGDGHLLRRLQEECPDCAVVGYEPMPEMHPQLVAAVAEKNLNRRVGIRRSLEVDVQDRFARLDVLEHLPAAAPLEFGLSSLAKNLARIAMRQTHGGTTLGNLTKAVLGAPIERAPGPFIYSHTGFYTWQLEPLFQADGLRIVSKAFSPFAKLDRWLNSQVFYVLR